MGDRWGFSTDQLMELAGMYMKRFLVYELLFQLKRPYSNDLQ